MRFFRDLIEQSLERTREATLGVLGINHPGLRRHLSESMVNTLGAEGCFLAPPVSSIPLAGRSLMYSCRSCRGSCFRQACWTPWSGLTIGQIRIFPSKRGHIDSVGTSIHTSTSCMPGARCWMKSHARQSSPPAPVRARPNASWYRSSRIWSASMSAARLHWWASAPCSSIRSML